MSKITEVPQDWSKPDNTVNASVTFTGDELSRIIEALDAWNEYLWHSGAEMPAERQTVFERITHNSELVGKINALRDKPIFKEKS